MKGSASTRSSCTATKVPPRLPTIAFLYLAKHTESFRGLTRDAALARFRALYPPYNPARGMAEYVRINWERYTP
jgi:hypothetical protein